MKNSLLSKYIAVLLPVAAAANSVPMTTEEIDSFVQLAEEKINQEISLAVSLPDNQKEFSQVMLPWNRLGIEILGNLSVLHYLSGQELPSNEAAAIALPKLVHFLFKSLVFQSSPYESLMQCAQRSLTSSSALDPYVCYEIHRLLESCESIRSTLSKEELEQLDRMIALSSSKEKKPFLSLKGNSPSKISPDKEFTVFCLNTCFQPGELPGYIYGGVAPWKEREAKLAEVILDADADVVCLQEVHGLEACYVLYERLKDNYSEFYLSIGPRVLGFSFQTLGLPSGLFVASKFPIDSPRFTLFPRSGLQMNYGCFDFLLNNAGVPLAHIYTTHMQSLNQKDFPEIRAEQLTHIVEIMEADYLRDEELKIPYFLCGDLNVPFGSGEPSEGLIRAYFHDAYNQDRGEVASEARTCTENLAQEYLSLYTGFTLPPVYEILDYALLLKTLPSCLCRTLSSDYMVDTSIIPMNSLDNPSAALSDHHALYTVIKENTP